MSKQRLGESAIEGIFAVAIACGLLGYAMRAVDNAKAATTEVVELLWAIGCFASVAGAVFILGVAALAFRDAWLDRGKVPAGVVATVAAGGEEDDGRPGVPATPAEVEYHMALVQRLIARGDKANCKMCFDAGVLLVPTPRSATSAYRFEICGCQKARKAVPT
jgi:hypothetical protein